MIKNLKSLRNAFGISQQQLADVILVSQQSVNKYENHNVEPDIDILCKMADCFNVSLDYLVGRTEVKEMATSISLSNLNKEEKDFIVSIRKLTDKQKNCIKTLIESYK